MSETTKTIPWVALKDFVHLFGVEVGTAKNKIANGTFEVPTYKLGNKIVADQAVIDAFFQKRRLEGLRVLDKSTST